MLSEMQTAISDHNHAQLASSFFSISFGTVNKAFIKKNQVLKEKKKNPTP